MKASVQTIPFIYLHLDALPSGRERILCQEGSSHYHQKGFLAHFGLKSHSSILENTKDVVGNMCKPCRMVG